MLACRPRVAPHTLFIPCRQHPRESRGIKSKIAGRKRHRNNEAGSNLFGEAPVFIKPKTLRPLSESRGVVPGSIDQLASPSITEAEHSPGECGSPVESRPPKYSTSKKTSSGVAKGRGPQKLEAFRAQIQLDYGQPMGQLARTNCAGSSPLINSKTGYDFISSFTIDAAQSVYIPGS